MKVSDIVEFAWGTVLVARTFEDKEMETRCFKVFDRWDRSRVRKEFGECEVKSITSSIMGGDTPTLFIIV